MISTIYKRTIIYITSAVIETLYIRLKVAINSNTVIEKEAKLKQLIMQTQTVSNVWYYYHIKLLLKEKNTMEKSQLFGQARIIKNKKNIFYFH